MRQSRTGGKKNSDESTGPARQATIGRTTWGCAIERTARLGPLGARLSQGRRHSEDFSRRMVAHFDM